MSNLGAYPAPATIINVGTVTTADDKAEDSVAVNGDIGSFILAVRNDTLAVTTSANGDYSPVSVDSRGGILNASNFAEDSLHVSGDTGTFAMAVRNDNSATVFTNANGDYSPISVDSVGRLQVIIPNAGGNIAKAEDGPAGNGDTGVFCLSVRRDTDGTQTSADGDYAEVQSDGRGAVRVNSVMRAPTATLTNVGNTGANVTALASNAARRGATIFNDDTALTGASVRIKFGATASATSFTTIIAPATYYEVPFGYTGIIDSISSAATGTLRVTELT